MMMGEHKERCGRSHISRSSSSSSSNSCNSSSSSSSSSSRGKRRRTMAALGLALLELTTTPCAGRTALRGSIMTPRTAPTKRVQYGGDTARNRRNKRRLQAGGGTGSGDGSAMKPERPEPVCASLFVPVIAGLFTGTYTHSGHYNDHRPVFSNPSTGCNIFATRTEDTAAETPGAAEANATWSWYMTNPSAQYFLSLESSVFEPAELPGIQSWVRHNDPDKECGKGTTGGTCVASMYLACTVYTADLFPPPAPTSAPTGAAAFSSSAGYGDVNVTASPSSSAYVNEASNSTAGTKTPAATPTRTPAPAAATTVANPTAAPAAAVANPGNGKPTATTTTTPAPSAPSASAASDAGDSDGGEGEGDGEEVETSTEENSSLPGCVNLQIRNGGTRAGVYLLNATSSANDPPSYAVVPDTIDGGGGGDATAELRADKVFSQKVSVCANGWGVVNSTWAESVGTLPLTATPREVFLMYVAENLELASDSECEVDVWFIADGGVTSLGDAGVNTFLSVCSLEDPSDAEVWAKFTPATKTERATLVDNSWIDVGCADAAAVEEAEGEEGSAMVVPTPPAPVGEEPNGKRRG